MMEPLDPQAPAPVSAPARAGALPMRPASPWERVYRISIWLRITLVVWAAIACSCTGIVLWAMHVQQATALQQARDFAGTVHQMTVAGLTGMMIIGGSARAGVFLEQIERTQNVTQLRVIRGDAVVRQYGRPAGGAVAPTDGERRVMQDGKPRFDLRQDPRDRKLKAVLPIVATSDYLGKNCLSCHAVAEGSIVGAVSMELALDRVYASGRLFAYAVAAAALAVGLLLALALYLVTTRFVTRPLTALADGLQGLADGRNVLQHTLPVRGSDEVAQAANAFNDVIARARELLDAERVAAGVFEHALECIIITDARGIILRVNRAFTETTGYSAGEAIGQTPRILQSGRHDRSFYDEFWRTLLEKGVWRGDIWNRRKNGEIYVQSANVTSVRNPEGEIEHFIAIFSDVTERRRHEAMIAHLAHHDVLTGLPNRAVFEDRLRQAIVSARRHGNHAVGVMFLDLDDFKRVNDTLGHDAGDLLLKEVTRRMRDALREEDTVSRLGGDEFTVLLPEVLDESAAMAVAQRLQKALEPPFETSTARIPIGASIGVSLFPRDGDTAQALLLCADQRMYGIKHARKQVRGDENALQATEAHHE